MAVEISLKGKNAIVTGGAGGMGYTTSALLAEAGANVMIADMNVEAAEKAAAELAEKYQVKTAFCKCDVTNIPEVEAMVAATLEAFGRIDILNHIAGMSTKVDFLEVPEKIYDLLMDVNAKGTFFVNQAVLKAMIPNGEGKIVNMSSMSGKEGFHTNVAYTAAKFAVTGMTQAIAKYAAPYNINVNCVCPGEGGRRRSGGLLAGAYRNHSSQTPPDPRGCCPDVPLFVLFLCGQYHRPVYQRKRRTDSALIFQ